MYIQLPQQWKLPIEASLRWILSVIRSLLFENKIRFYLFLLVLLYILFFIRVFRPSPDIYKNKTNTSNAYNIIKIRTTLFTSPFYFVAVWDKRKKGVQVYWS